MTNWAGRTVLVTGAGGFIGSHLTEALVHAGARTRALVEYDSLGSWGWLNHSSVKDDIEVFAGDVRDRDSLRSPMDGVDLVFHLAALIAIPYSYRAPMSYVETNVAGTLNVLQAARDADVTRFVHTSTSEVYGTALRVPIDEAHPLQGQSPYSASKIGADKMAEAFHRSFELPVVTVRPFNTYGPRQSDRAIIPTIITQALTLDTIRIGNRTPTRDFNYVADTVDGFMAVALADGVVGETFNLGTSREISIGDLAEMINRLVGRDLPVEIDAARLRPEASEVDRLCASSAHVQAATGWHPRHSLEQGIEKTIAWVQDNLNAYRPGAYAV